MVDLASDDSILQIITDVASNHSLIKFSRDKILSFSSKYYGLRPGVCRGAEGLVPSKVI